MEAFEQERWRDYDLVELHTIYAALVNPQVHFHMQSEDPVMLNVDKAEVFRLIVERIEG